MNPIRIPGKSWVVVCDGAKALILQNNGNADTLKLKVVETLSQPNLPTRELGTDSPGRAHHSFGTARSAMEETDLHAVAEAEFLKTVSNRLSDLVRDEDVGSVVLVASPEALGILRPTLSAAVETLISAEIAKNYTQLPIPEIENNLNRLAA